MEAVKIVFFDGVCNLCNASVQRIIQNDRHNQFKFASLQSDFGQAFLKKHHFDTERFTSIILLDNAKVYTESDAVLRIAQDLNGKYRWLGHLRILPKFFRDAIYRWVANNRYRWFGQQKDCWLPTPKLKDKFIN
ncbi:MAG TPA: thiol-disulfide oxidoreductase DCC family protein [Moheibacter sp.]|nr:thiol-disulfide oxidoreductase DCC family protein [Moheibacter sp.]